MVPVHQRGAVLQVHSRRPALLPPCDMQARMHTPGAAIVVGLPVVVHPEGAAAGHLVGLQGLPWWRPGRPGSFLLAALWGGLVLHFTLVACRRAVQCQLNNSCRSVMLRLKLPCTCCPKVCVHGKEQIKGCMVPAEVRRSSGERCCMHARKKQRTILCCGVRGLATIRLAQAVCRSIPACCAQGKPLKVRCHTCGHTGSAWNLRLYGGCRPQHKQWIAVILPKAQGTSPGSVHTQSCRLQDCLRGRSVPCWQYGLLLIHNSSSSHDRDDRMGPSANQRQIVAQLVLQGPGLYLLWLAPIRALLRHPRHHLRHRWQHLAWPPAAPLPPHCP